MPSSIPYDHPSLVLGNIVDPKILNILREVDGLQSDIDTAYDRLNALIMLKRKLSMMMNELINLKIDIGDIKEKIHDVDEGISKAALDYMNVSLTNEEAIVAKRDEINGIEIEDNLESPVDFSTSKVKYMPLSSESIKLDAQYFSYAAKQEDDVMVSIQQFIKDSTSNMGTKSADIAKEASSQISRQKESHSLAGTLIITASCTHKNVGMLEPLNIDADKAVNIWNAHFKNKADQIDTTDIEAINALYEASVTNQSKYITLLSGVSYGSSFVGMVHILNTESAQTGLSLEEINRLQQQMQIGGWLQNEAGGIGIDSTISDEVKKALSTNNVSSHVSMVVMGAVPTIVANNVALGLNQFTNNAALKTQNLLGVLDQEDDEGPSSSTKNGADSAKTAKRMMSIEQNNTESIITSLGKIDHGNNKVLDINSMMIAFDNYVKDIRSGNTNNSVVGVPINFYLKKLSQNDIAKLWVDKYYPQNENTNKESE